MGRSALRAAFAVSMALACTRCASVPSADAIDKRAAAALAGEWGIQIKESGHTVEGTLHFSFDGTALVGSYLGPEGEVRELEKVRVADGKVFWTMEQKSGSMTARGTLDGTIMSGKMKVRPHDDDGGIAVSGGGRGRARVSEFSLTWTAIKRAAS
ncbi:MAG: hypothetical protein ACRD16_01605 [Thermoanaerobaculia bacterium]